MEIKNLIISMLNQNLELLIGFVPKLVAAILLLVVIFYFSKAFNKLILKLTKKSKFSKDYVSLFLKISKTFLVFVSVIIVLRILGFKGLSAGIFASGGIVTIILGFALREIGENFCAGLLLSINKPFKIGDTIKSQDVEGKVQSIQIRHTHIRSADGRDIYVPSSQIYKNTLINYTKDGLRRFDFVIGVDYSSDLKAVCSLIDKEISAINGVLQDPKSGCVVNSLLPQYIEVIVYFWINIDESITIKQVKQDAISNIKDKLMAEGVVLSNNTSSNHNINMRNEEKK